MFMLFAIYNITVTQIVHSRGKLTRMRQEHEKLLNEMHEGLVIVSESDESLQFASKPAIMLLMDMPE